GLPEAPRHAELLRPRSRRSQASRQPEPALDATARDARHRLLATGRVVLRSSSTFGSLNSIRSGCKPPLRISVVVASRNCRALRGAAAIDLNINREANADAPTHSRAAGDDRGEGAASIGGWTRYRCVPCAETPCGEWRSRRLSYARLLVRFR